MQTTLNINIADKRWSDRLPQCEEVSPFAFQKVIEHLSPKILAAKSEVSINLELSSDAEIQVLNREFRNMDKPTNVLSFANVDDDDFYNQLPQMSEVELGDIIIALETIEKESSELEISLSDHYHHILVHGILHLLGYDHIEEDERLEMEALETSLLADFGIANPYEEQV